MIRQGSKPKRAQITGVKVPEILKFDAHKGPKPKNFRITGLESKKKIQEGKPETANITGGKHI